jgi:hypothetical protein
MVRKYRLPVLGQWYTEKGGWKGRQDADIRPIHRPSWTQHGSERPLLVGEVNANFSG